MTNTNARTETMVLLRLAFCGVQLKDGPGGLIERVHGDTLDHLLSAGLIEMAGPAALRLTLAGYLHVSALVTGAVDAHTARTPVGKALR